MKRILKAGTLDNKDYVLKLRLEDGTDVVWKAPRPNTNPESQLREQYNEILSGWVFDELIDSRLEAHLEQVNQEFGTVTNFIEEDWDSNRSLASYTNSDKMPIFFGLEVWFHQQDRNNGASRHLRIKINNDLTATICPIDNGFSFMFIDGSQTDPRKDLNPEFIDGLLSATFVSSESDIETVILVIDSVDVNRIVQDVASHFVTTCSFTPNTKSFIYGYSRQLISYLEKRRELMKSAIRGWWRLKSEGIKKVEVPVNAVP